MTEPLDLDYIVGWTWDEEQVDQIVDSLVHELRAARERIKKLEARNNQISGTDTDKPKLEDH